MTIPRLGLLLLVASMLLTLACTDDEDGDAGNFYAEIRVEVEPQPDDPLAHIGSAAVSTSIRWWHSDEPQRWRWEFEATGPSLDAGTRVTVFDGASSWGYDDRSLTYSEEQDFGLPAGVVLSPTFSAPVGPANAPDIDTFIEEWRGRGGDADIRRVGEDTVLGRRVEIVEIRPAWRSSSDSATAPSDGTATSTPAPSSADESGGVVRVAIDPERMFVMRWEVDGEGDGQSYRAEVVSLDYGASIDASRFAFDPPTDATEAPEDDGGACSGSSGMLGGATVSVPPGFLTPALIPAGFQSVGSGSESGRGCATAAAWTLLERDGGGYLVLRQRMRHALPDSLLAWDPVPLDRGDGYRDPGDSTQRLAWQQGEVAVMLESDALTIEELIEIANSME